MQCDIAWHYLFPKQPFFWYFFSFHQALVNCTSEEWRDTSSGDKTTTRKAYSRPFSSFLHTTPTSNFCSLCALIVCLHLCVYSSNMGTFYLFYHGILLAFVFYECVTNTGLFACILSVCFYNKLLLVHYYSFSSSMTAFKVLLNVEGNVNILLLYTISYRLRKRNGQSKSFVDETRLRLYPSGCQTSVRLHKEVSNTVSYRPLVHRIMNCLKLYFCLPETTACTLSISKV